MGKQLINLVGQRFGRLTVVKRGPNNKHKQSQWYCKCDCGNEKLVCILLLRNGKTRSCGCLHRDTHSTHGMYKTKIYSIWHNMNSRCNNGNNIYYGGKGIVVCERWKGQNGFVHFLNDMGEPPSDEHTIDRINYDGIYELSNCKWSTMKEQNTNKSDTKLTKYDVNNIRKTYRSNQYNFAELGRMYNCDPSHIRKIVLQERW